MAITASGPGLERGWFWRPLQFNRRLEPAEFLTLVRNAEAGRRIREGVSELAERCPRLADESAAIPDLADLVKAVSAMEEIAGFLDDLNPYLKAMAMLGVCQVLGGELGDPVG